MKHRYISKRKIELTVIAILLVFSIFVAFDYHFYSDNIKKQVSTYNQETKNYLASTNLDYVYVSDIDFKSYKVGYGQLVRNKTGSNTLITLKMDSSYFPFEKGIWAHASSSIDIDLTKYKDYAYFTTYYGVNQTSNNNGNGVKFYIYTSVDGVDWKLETEENPKALKSSDPAVFVKIDIREVNYLRLVANDNGANGNDHSVWADSKLVKEGYQEKNYTKTLEEYDAEIKTKYPDAQVSENSDDLTDYEKLLLQREFVRSVGQYTLNAFAKENTEYQETLKWLMEEDNGKNLRLYLLGGTPDGSYYQSLIELSRLYHAYQNDFKDTTQTKYGVTLGDLYKKMAITLSLTHSTTVGLWMNPSAPSNQSDSLERYRIYKLLHNEGKFKVTENQDQTKWFEHLEVEEMRYVMNNIIDDEEILWLNDYTQKYINEHPTEPETYLQPHKYMKYIWPDYSKPEYYLESKLSYWDEKYGYFNSKYHVTYGVEKLWMNLDNGAVCGGISKIGSNIRGVHGTPSSVINQPGHAAIIYWREDENGNGYWTLDNDVSGWPNSNKTEKLSVRMPLGWGDQSYLNSTNVSEGVVNYVLLAQAALNNFDDYQKSREIYFQADVYRNDANKKLAIYEEAVKTLPINIDAWYGIIETYQELGKTKADYLALALRIFEALKDYPLPMFHLGEEIEPLIETEDHTYLFQFLQARTEYLNKASNISNSEHIQAAAIRAEANYLLKKEDTSLATFSFDGEAPNTIQLSQKYEGSGVRWDFCLKGKENCIGSNTNWKEITSQNSYVLTADELKEISSSTDIYVHIVGVGYDEKNIYGIDITDGVIDNTTLYGNDLENRVLGVDTSYEWRMKGDINWKSYLTVSPDLTDEKVIEVRRGAVGTSLPSNILEFSFTKEIQNVKETYIPVSSYSLLSCSSEATEHGRDARYSLDGNLNTSWHSDWNGNDKERYIIIQLDQPYYISALDYVPRPSNSNNDNGRVVEAKIEVSLDGEEWQTVVESVDLANNVDAKHVSFNPTEAQYVRFTGLKTTGSKSFITASMFNLYNDSTQITHPTATIAYSTISPTKDEVVARVVNSNRPITVIPSDNNPEGLDSYTFTENGEYTFNFKDENDLEGSVTAKVDWIDKEAPSAEIKFNTKAATNQEVLAKLQFSEEVAIIDDISVIDEELESEEEEEDKLLTLLTEHELVFEDNGTIVLHYRDKAGNIGTTNVSVSWIDTITPTADVLYSNLKSDATEVTVSLSPSEDITVLNNNGKKEYTFTKNGDFTFEFKDAAGNYGSATAQVDWIVSKPDHSQNSSHNENKPQNEFSKEESQDVTISSDISVNKSNNQTSKSSSKNSKIFNSSSTNSNDNINENLDNEQLDEEEEITEDVPIENEENPEEKKQEEKVSNLEIDTNQEYCKTMLVYIASGIVILLGSIVYIKHNK